MTRGTGRRFKKGKVWVGKEGSRSKVQGSDEKAAGKNITGGFSIVTRKDGQQKEEKGELDHNPESSHVALQLA